MDKLIAITGGSKGMGKAIGQKFHQEGFAVALCSRNKNDLEQVKKELGGKSVHTFVADVSKKEDVKAFADFVLSLNIPVKCLVNNAGLYLTGNILEEDDETLASLLDTNLFSAYYLTKGLIQNLKAQERSHIFNISSVAGLEPIANCGSYSISKFALSGFSKNIREELKDTNVKVTTIYPGATLTNSWAGTSIPESKFILAKDIAETVWMAFNLSKGAVLEEIVIRPQARTM